METRDPLCDSPPLSRRGRLGSTRADARTACPTCHGGSQCRGRPGARTASVAPSRFSNSSVLAAAATWTAAVRLRGPGPCGLTRQSPMPDVPLAAGTSRNPSDKHMSISRRRWVLVSSELSALSIFSGIPGAQRLVCRKETTQPDGTRRANRQSRMHAARCCPDGAANLALKERVCSPRRTQIRAQHNRAVRRTDRQPRALTICPSTRPDARVNTSGVPHGATRSSPNVPRAAEHGS